MTRFLFTVFCGMFIDASAAVIPLALGSPYTQHFDDPRLSITAPHGGNWLPAGWAFDDQADHRYRVSDGRRGKADVYSFGEKGSTERALGSLNRDAVSTVFGAAFQNVSGQTITRLDISFFGEEWRLGLSDGNRDRLSFQYSLNANSIDRGVWVDVKALEFAPPDTSGKPGARDGNRPANRQFISGSIAVNVPAGATLWIRWNDLALPSGNDGLAVDDFRLVAVPETSTWSAALACVVLLFACVWPAQMPRPWRPNRRREGERPLEP